MKNMQKIRWVQMAVQQDQKIKRKNGLTLARFFLLNLQDFEKASLNPVKKETCIKFACFSFLSVILKLLSLSTIFYNIFPCSFTSSLTCLIFFGSITL